MGSKKQRADRKLERLITPSAPIQKTKAEKKKRPALIAPASTPFYTAIFMVIGIVVLYFIANIVMNTIVADICLQNNPSLIESTDALKLATEQYVSEHPLYNIILGILLNASGILAMMFLFYRLEKCELPSIGLFSTEKTKTDVIVGLLMGFASALVVYNLLLMCGFIKPTGALVFNYYQIAWTAYVLFMAVFEEMFFRGYIMFKFGGKNAAIGIALSSVAFALYKGLPSTSPATYVTYLILGVMLAYSVKLFKTLWFAGCFRILWSLTSAIILSMDSSVILGFVENSGLTENILSGSRAGCENGLIAGFVFALCLVFTVYMNRKRNEPHVRRIHRDGTIH